MGKRSGFERNPRDYYPTPLDAVHPLMSVLPFGSTFIEPCTGNSDLVKHLSIHHACTCLAQYDIEPQNNDVKYLDALELKEKHVGSAEYIITNPPWTRTKRSGFLLHNLVEVFANLLPTWLLIDSDWHDTKQSSELIRKYCCKIVPIGRVKWIPDSKHAGKDNCSWYLFNRYKDGDCVFYPRI